jgi:hypothetical protein
MDGFHSSQIRCLSCTAIYPPVEKQYDLDFQTMTTSVTTSAAPTIPKSNVDRIIDDVSKGIFDWTKTSMTAADLNKEQQILANIAGILPKVSEVPSVTPQPMPQSSKKRHAQNTLLQNYSYHD